MLRAGALLWFLLSSVAVTSQAGASPYETFFGEYVGETISELSGEIGTRDLRVEIGPHRDGFTVTWVTVIRKASGKVKRDPISINFKPTKRPNIYSSAMTVDVFGRPVPLDPLGGDPYVWARIEGATLTVYMLLITDEGGYEMHTYERTLTPDGMHIEFSRVRDGAVLRTVTGRLKRAP